MRTVKIGPDLRLSPRDCLNVFIQGAWQWILLAFLIRETRLQACNVKICIFLEVDELVKLDTWNLFHTSKRTQNDMLSYYNQFYFWSPNSLNCPICNTQKKSSYGQAIMNNNNNDNKVVWHLNKG